jgi:hypothetical protein
MTPPFDATSMSPSIPQPADTVFGVMVPAGGRHAS